MRTTSYPKSDASLSHRSQPLSNANDTKNVDTNADLKTDSSTWYRYDRYRYYPYYQPSYYPYYWPYGNRYNHPYYHRYPSNNYYGHYYTGMSFIVAACFGRVICGILTGSAQIKKTSVKFSIEMVLQTERVIKPTTTTAAKTVAITKCI